MHVNHQHRPAPSHRCGGQHFRPSTHGFTIHAFIHALVPQADQRLAKHDESRQNNRRGTALQTLHIPACLTTWICRPLDSVAATGGAIAVTRT